MMSSATCVGFVSSAPVTAATATPAFVTRPSNTVTLLSSSSVATSLSSRLIPAASHCSMRRSRRISCEVALKSDSETATSTSSSGGEKDAGEEAKIGAKVRVKVPLKVYHVPKVAEVDLTGKEGELKQYVGLWKGKRISANLPYKVEFYTHVEGRGSVKFFAHLKEDEFEYL